MTASPTAPLEFKVNKHVERLSRYVPLDAGADQLVHEHVDVEQATDIPTRADQSLLEAVQSPRIRLVLLTGDAGHGKTRLCYELVEQLGNSAVEAAALVRDRGLADADLATLEDGRRLRIIKDLSDLEPEEGAEAVVDALDATQRVTVVCANEGRLRDIVSRRGDRLGSLLRQLEESLGGEAAEAEGILILNLNFQSVAANEAPMTGGLLRQWVGDGRSWSVCSTCRAQPLCPIYENKRLLADAPHHDRRVARWSELLRVTERTGVVITIRELLIAVAFSLTGGLRCHEVHARVTAKPVDRKWQWRHLFFQVIFGEMQRLEETSPGLRLPPAMSMLDAGAYADRRIDEHLVVDREDRSFRPLDPTGDVIGLDWRGTSDQVSRMQQLTLARFLRRRAFFEDEAPPAMARLGLRFGADFESALDGTGGRTLRDRVVSGLAAVQGLVQTGARWASLPVVEPALAGQGNGVAILDRDIPLPAVEVMPLSDAWERRLQRRAELPQQVDWSERAVAVVIERTHLIQLDLRTFELVCAAGEGLDLATADPGVTRRLLLQLARLANASAETDRITVIEGSTRWRIDLDIDDQLIGERT